MSNEELKAACRKVITADDNADEAPWRTTEEIDGAATHTRISSATAWKVASTAFYFGRPCPSRDQQEKTAAAIVSFRNHCPVIARALLERLEQEERKQRDLEAEYCSTHYQSQPCGTCYWEKKAGDE
jgi:hypothetical protein